MTVLAIKRLTDGSGNRYVSAFSLPGELPSAIEDHPILSWLDWAILDGTWYAVIRNGNLRYQLEAYETPIVRGLPRFTGLNTEIDPELGVVFTVFAHQPIVLHSHLLPVLEILNVLQHDSDLLEGSDGTDHSEGR